MFVCLFSLVSLLAGLCLLVPLSLSHVCTTIRLILLPISAHPSVCVTLYVCVNWCIILLLSDYQFINVFSVYYRPWSVSLSRMYQCQSSSISCYQGLRLLVTVYESVSLRQGSSDTQPTFQG